MPNYIVVDKREPNFRVSNLRSCKWALWGNLHYAGSCTECPYPFCYHDAPAAFVAKFEVAEGRHAVQKP